MVKKLNLVAEKLFVMGWGNLSFLADEVADTVITNALIVDWWGIVKADVGLKNGRIWKIGKLETLIFNPTLLFL